MIIVCGKAWQALIWLLICHVIQRTCPCASRIHAQVQWTLVKGT